MAITDQAWKEYLVSRSESDRELECIRVYHSAFSKVYYLARDNQEFTANLPVTKELVTFEPANLEPSRAINSNDLDQGATFTIGDLDNILDDELDRIPDGDTEQIQLTHYIYLKSATTEPQFYISYDIKSVAQEKGAFSVTAGTRDLNRDKTGDTYDFGIYEPLRGL